MNLKRMSELGRSMVEMLGVLAVIGILSVAGVAGYQLAMKKHVENELKSELVMRAIDVSSQILAGKNPDISGFPGEVRGYSMELAATPNSSAYLDEDGNEIPLEEVVIGPSEEKFAIAVGNLPESLVEFFVELASQTGIIQSVVDSKGKKINLNSTDFLDSDGKTIKIYVIFKSDLAMKSKEELKDAVKNAAGCQSGTPSWILGYGSGCICPDNKGGEKCQEETPCQNGHWFDQLNTEGGVCLCDTGYTGVYCNEKVGNSPCQIEGKNTEGLACMQAGIPGKCRNGGCIISGQYKCTKIDGQCAEGYFCHFGGQNTPNTCEEVNYDKKEIDGNTYYVNQDTDLRSWCRAKNGKDCDWGFLTYEGAQSWCAGIEDGDEKVSAQLLTGDEFKKVYSKLGLPAVLDDQKYWLQDGQVITVKGKTETVTDTTTGAAAVVCVKSQASGEFAGNLTAVEQKFIANMKINYDSLKDFEVGEADKSNDYYQTALTLNEIKALSKEIVDLSGVLSHPADPGYAQAVKTLREKYNQAKELWKKLEKWNKDQKNQVALLVKDIIQNFGVKTAWADSEPEFVGDPDVVNYACQHLCPLGTSFCRGECCFQACDISGKCPSPCLGKEKFSITQGKICKCPIGTTWIDAESGTDDWLESIGADPSSENEENSLPHGECCPRGSVLHNNQCHCLNGEDSKGNCCQDSVKESAKYGKICECPAGTNWTTLSTAGFYDVSSGAEEYLDLTFSGECCPDGSEWNGKECATPCDRETSLLGGEWAKDAEGHCCRREDIWTDGTCCPSDFRAEAEHICCPKSQHASNGHCCDQGLEWSEDTFGGFLGMMKTKTSACCPLGKKWNAKEQKCCGEGECSCPDGGIQQNGTCCKDGKGYNPKTNEYSEYNPSCGCPYPGVEQNGVCCLGLDEYNPSVQGYVYSYFSSCSCPDGGEKKERTCCKNGKAYNCTLDDTVEGKKVLMNCGYFYVEDICCPPGTHVLTAGGAASGGHKMCCPEGTEPSYSGATEESTGEGIYACCPEGEGAISDGTCCPNDRRTRDKDNKFFCCPKGEHASWTGENNEDIQRSTIEVCCPEGEGAISDGTCCPLGRRGADKDGKYFCCPKGQNSSPTDEKSGDGTPIYTCCPADEEAASDGSCCPFSRWGKDKDERAFCCPEGQYAASTGEQTEKYTLIHTCCPEGESATSDGRCCPNNRAGVDKNGKYFCCPEGEHASLGSNTIETKCCPMGQEWKEEKQKCDNICPTWEGVISDGTCCPHDRIRRDKDRKSFCCPEGEHASWTGEIYGEWYIRTCCPIGQEWNEEKQKCDSGCPDGEVDVTRSVHKGADGKWYLL